ncbi:TMAO reductase [Vibrio galatheae]|uniref:TMAO reductase n=1 Tax=Vibrio galatheae TaxID=579748 RepID=A0A0F4NL28_9VIBR|nr:TMAO reductase system periplasmic protein TorT [Vibrio galatheae]KJY83842.1 TMAO reductase [Vibrio galatheae]
MSLISAIKLSLKVVTALLVSISVPTSVSFATEPTMICAIYPHLKDSYWLSVNYGMVDQAKKEGIELRVLESGGYLNLEKQREQMSQCVEWQADAIILGSVSPELFYSSLNSVAASIPVFATVNQLTLDNSNQAALKGQVGVNWYWMGFYAGDYLKTKHPIGSGVVNVVLLPGPQLSGGTKPVIEGFYSAIAASDINVVETYWADNDKELQRNLVQIAIDNKNIDYIVGSAVAIEAAISELRSTNLTNEIKLISTYLSHGVYRGLLRNKVEFAPTDKMVLQGRMSILQATHYLRGEDYNKKQAPTIESLTPQNLNPEVIAQSLSPSEYRPTFNVYSENN